MIDQIEAVTRIPISMIFLMDKAALSGSRLLISFMTETNKACNHKSMTRPLIESLKNIAGSVAQV